MKVMQHEAGLPEHEARLYAELRQAGVDPGDALRLTTAIFPPPPPDPREAQRQRQREHGRLPAVRRYTGL